MIDPEQIRAGRALLDWSQQRLADAAGLSLRVVKKAETDDQAIRLRSFKAIAAALEAAGVVFLTDRDAPQITKGVGLKRKDGST